MNQKKERLADNICLRVTARQREFLVKRSEEMNTTLCEGTRRLIDGMMAMAGTEI